MSTLRRFPRDFRGKAVSRQCPDPNCGGRLQHEGDDWWRCDGLTHMTDTGPLFACEEFVPPPRLAADYGMAA